MAEMAAKFRELGSEVYVDAGAVEQAKKSSEGHG